MFWNGVPQVSRLVSPLRTTAISWKNCVACCKCHPPPESKTCLPRLWKCWSTFPVFSLQFTQTNICKANIYKITKQTFISIIFSINPINNSILKIFYSAVTLRVNPQNVKWHNVSLILVRSKYHTLFTRERRGDNEHVTLSLCCLRLFYMHLCRIGNAARFHFLKTIPTNRKFTSHINFIRHPNIKVMLSKSFLNSFKFYITYFKFLFWSYSIYKLAHRNILKKNHISRQSKKSRWLNQSQKQFQRIS